MSGNWQWWDLLWLLVSVGKVSVVEWQKRWTGKQCSPISNDLGSQGKTPQRRDLQKQILPWWQSALKWGLGVAFTCAPRADLVLSPGDQSVVQAFFFIISLALLIGKDRRLSVFVSHLPSLLKYCFFKICFWNQHSEKHGSAEIEGQLKLCPPCREGWAMTGLCS